VARRGEKMVGYSSYMVLPHLHYSKTLHAMNDAIFVMPKERGAGIGLIRAAERALAEIARPGYVRIIYHAKLHVESERGTLARVFERLGYSAFETSHDKVVRG
jgi:GNAT superfamily N-acetyltransferase